MTIGEIVECFSQRMSDGDKAGALDALDLFFREWDPELSGLRPGERDKLLRDVRGLIIEAYRAGQAAADVPVLV